MATPGDLFQVPLEPSAAFTSCVHSARIAGRQEASSPGRGNLPCQGASFPGICREPATRLAHCEVLWAALGMATSH